MVGIRVACIGWRCLASSSAELPASLLNSWQSTLNAHWTRLSRRPLFAFSLVSVRPLFAHLASNFLCDLPPPPPSSAHHPSVCCFSHLAPPVASRLSGTAASPCSSYSCPLSWTLHCTMSVDEADRLLADSIAATSDPTLSSSQLLSMRRLSTASLVWAVPLSLLALFAAYCLFELAGRTPPTSLSSSASSSYSSVGYMPNGRVTLDEAGCAIMSMAAGYHGNSLLPFLASARRQCPGCHIILFLNVSILTAEDWGMVHYYHIELMDVDELQSLYDTDTITGNTAKFRPAAALWEIMYDYLRAMSPIDQQPPSSHTNRRNPITPQLIQRSRYEAFMSSNERVSSPWSTDARLTRVKREAVERSVPLVPFTHVFFCDVRDVYFQANIFNVLPYDGEHNNDDQRWGTAHNPMGSSPIATVQPASSPFPLPSSSIPTFDGLWVFAEEVSISNEAVNTKWVTCGDPEFIERHKTTPLPVICSGSALASYPSALIWLASFVGTLYANLSCTQDLPGFDQGAHQLSLYNDILPNALTPT